MKIYFIGIKGTGMAALAEILHEQGHAVRGSDIEKYVFTEEGLKQRNIEILPFNPDNIQPGDVVVAGLAFGPDHPEVKKALEMDGVEVFWYNEYLGRFIKDYRSICVAGCHGKSTTTGLLAHVLEEFTPTGFLIGDGHGHLPENTDVFVLESCEFKRHFLAYHPDYALITNIELDHIDYYRDLEDYISAFQSFADQIQKLAVIWGDDPYLKDLHYPVPVVTYGTGEGCLYRAVNITEDEHGSDFDMTKEGKILCHVHLNESGLPFLWDACGVFAMASELGMEAEDIAAKLETFAGINRRFVIEEAGDSVLVDDYAHHPTAISQMIRSARHRWPGRKVIALYKPDRYSRLQYFLERFASSLNEADASYVLDFDANIHPEDETVSVTINDLLERLDNGGLLKIDEDSAQVLEEAGPAVYLFMSSKNIYLLKDLLKNRILSR